MEDGIASVSCLIKQNFEVFCVIYSISTFLTGGL